MKIEHSTLLIHKSKLTCQLVQSFFHIIKCGTRYYIYIYAFILQYMLCNTITSYPPSVHWAPQNSLKLEISLICLRWIHPWSLTWNQNISPWKRRLQLETIVFQGGIPPVMSYCMAILPSRELTYPTRGKGKSSSNVHFGRDMLVSRRVIEEKHRISVAVGDGLSHHMFPGRSLL